MATVGLIVGGAMFPEGLKAGDFVQLNSHFSDIFFEVESAWAINSYWHITYFRYEKYARKPRTDWANCGGSGVRQVIKADMAVPTMMVRHLRFHASFGQYDPLYGFAPAGVPLRLRETA